MGFLGENLPMPERWRAGDVIALRNVWGGRALTVFPAIVVEDSEQRRTFHVRSGSTVQTAIDPNGRRVRIPAGSWRLEPRPWKDVDILSFAWRQVPYSVMLFWSHADGAFRGWYVNIEAPLVPTPVGFDYVDHILDIVVAPDLSWRWKDEDELLEAARLGLISPKEEERIRDAGWDAIRRLEAREEPFDDAWIGWRPDPSWPMPQLPDGWDTGPCG
jgi:hypothetical protein